MKIYFCENCGKDYSVKQFQEVDLDIYSYVCECGYEEIYKDY